MTCSFVPGGFLRYRGLSSVEDSPGISGYRPQQMSPDNANPWYQGRNRETGQLHLAEVYDPVMQRLGGSGIVRIERGKTGNLFP